MGIGLKAGGFHMGMDTTTESKFLGHEPCPYCKSSDALARYDDGHGHCFSCKYTEPSTKRWKELTNKKDSVIKGLRPLPDDTSPPIGAIGWQWLAKYDIHEAETQDFLWSDDKQWLIFPFRDADRNLLAWQARNFNKERPKPKYYTQGPIGDMLAFYGTGDTLVLTEDVISAIKVGRSSGIVGMPIFGSSVSLKLITRLATLFKSVGIWLDMDKARESSLARSRASQFVPHTFCILSPKDPKEYNDIEISSYILSHLLKSA